MPNCVKVDLYYYRGLNDVVVHYIADIAAVLATCSIMAIVTGPRLHQSGAGGCMHAV